MSENEDELYSRSRDYIGMQIGEGRVLGIYDKGDPGGQPGWRHTLMRVQMVPRGGERICAISSIGGGRIPKVGTRVIVGIPKDRETNIGATVILGTIEDDPERLEEDRRVLDFGDEHVIIRAKSITLESTEGDFVAVGTPRAGGTAGITVCTADGSAGAVWQTAVASMWTAASGDAKSLLQLTPSAAELVQKDTGFVRLKGGDITTRASGKGTYLAASSYVGTGLPPVTPPAGAAYGAGPAAVASTTVWISP